jgi:predicted AAA+ superfamily ATPase
VAVRGPRQVGKTTIQEQLIEQLLKLDHIPPSQIFRMEFDDAPSLGSYTQPVVTLVRWFEENVLKGSLNAFANRNEPVYLFFDEVQNLKDWAVQLKTLVDHRKAKIVVTGSSALRIGGGSGSLVGRVSMLELGPFRLNEIAGVRGLGDLPAFEPDTTVEDWTGRDFWLDLAAYAQQHKRVLRKAFDVFSEVGGYPVGHKPQAKRSELGTQIANDVVKRTVRQDLRAGQGGKRQRSEIIEETYRQICRYAGQEITPNRIRQEVENVLGLGVPQNAVRNAIRFLADALLVHEIFPMEALAKRQSHSPKLCLCDHFVREAWLQEKLPVSLSELANAREEICTAAGHLIESDIGYYLKGIPGLNVSWFPKRGEEPEVDFVLTIGLKRIPIEVKYRRGQLKPEHLRGIQSFCSQAKYNAPFGLLITQDISGAIADNIIALPAYALLSVR